MRQQPCLPQHAADQTKGAFKGANDISESIRTNVNSGADNILGGNKTHSSTGVHPDTKRAGAEMEKGVNSAGKKLDGMMNKKK